MKARHDSKSGSHDRASAGSRQAAVTREPDALSDVLRAVRLCNALFFMWDVSWPFATPVPAGRSFAPILLPRAQEIISYHIVTEGRCWGALVGEPPVPLEAGDILLVPHGDAYVIASSAEGCASPALDTEAAFAFFRHMAGGELPFVVADGGGGDTATHLVCGFLGCDVRPFNPVLSALPRLVRVRRVPGAAPDRLQTLIDYTLAEAREPRAGGQSVLLRLSELLFVEAIRRYLDAAPQAQTGWLAALRDPVVGRALMRLHAQPAVPWTLASLADALCVSRSRLAESFTHFVGQPPMQYLTQWRMQLAARLLVDDKAKVAVVAHEVGYESEAAFSRAFKRLTGVAPGRWKAGEIEDTPQLPRV